jgi:glycosyltransferase involved in cell wall biosynthesis
MPTLAVGGAEKMVTRLLPALDSSRFKIRLICTGEEGELFSELKAAKVPAISLHAGGKAKAVQCFWRISRQIREFKPDVILTQGAGTTVLARIAATLHGVRHKVVWAHSSVRQRNPLREALDRALIPLTTVFIGVCDSQIKHLENKCHYPRHKIRIIKNGVSPSAFTNARSQKILEEIGAEQGSRVVGMIARLHPVKDHKTFILSARSVLRSKPETQFLIIGDGPLRQELEDFCRVAGMDSKIHFAGLCRNIEQLFAAIDVLAHCSHSEGLPLAILEAMACGRPVVGTNVGGVKELIQHGVTGYLVPPENPEVVANHLLELLNNESLCREMGAAARYRIETKFNFLSVVRAFETLLTELNTNKQVRTTTEKTHQIRAYGDSNE